MLLLGRPTLKGLTCNVTNATITVNEIATLLPVFDQQCSVFSTPMKTANAASKTETNRDNTNLETDNPDIINHPGNAEKMEMD